MNEFEHAAQRFSAQMAQLSEVNRRCAELVATGTAQRGRVRVTVNADGIAVGIGFGAGATELTYDELADAVSEASRIAVADVAAQQRELLAPLALDEVEMPSIDSLFAAIDGLREHLR
ncbi:YbaB/EbfC family nucleoid-associated protein [Nocardia gipuzkoensis]